MTQQRLVKIILFVIGVATIIVGINVGFGGILTLGWQVSPDFVTVQDTANFDIQDNHVRYLGGFFMAAGAFFLLAITDLSKYKTTLRAIFAFYFIGGLMRLSAGSLGLVLSSSIITSFAIEIILMPILFVWLGYIAPNEQSN